MKTRDANGMVRQLQKREDRIRELEAALHKIAGADQWMMTSDAAASTAAAIAREALSK